MAKRVSRRGFIGAISAAFAAGSLAKVAHAVSRRKSEVKIISVSQIVPREISQAEMAKRYIQPAVEMLCERIDREAIQYFVKLPLPTFAPFAAQITVARNKIPARLITSYSPIYDEMVFRVDCGYYA